MSRDARFRVSGLREFGALQESCRIRAECKDCHEPGDWWHRFEAKVLSVNDLYNHIAGTISTREKFEKHRPELDAAVWAQMKANDSRTCRKCHSWSAMLTSTQPPAARASHEMAQRAGLTCIDCHRGIMRMKGNFSSGTQPARTAQ